MAANAVVTSGKSHTVIRSQMVFDPSHLGGAVVAAKDVDGDGKCDVIVAPAKKEAALVRVLSGIDLTSELQSFLAYDSLFQGGVWVG